MSDRQKDNIRKIKRKLTQIILKPIKKKKQINEMDFNSSVSWIENGES